MMISKLDRCEREKILSPPRKISQFFDKNKDDRTSIFRRKREHAKDHSIKHCEQTWNDTAKIGNLTGRKLPLHHLHSNGGNTNTRTLNGEINFGGNSDGHRLFQSHVDFFAGFAHRHQRMSFTRREVKTERFVARTIFLSVAHTSPSHAPACGSRAWRIKFGMCCTSAHLKSHPLTACFIDHSLMCLTHFLPFCSTPPPSTPTSLPKTGIRRSLCATLHGGLQIGRLVDPTPLTGCEPKTCIDVSSELTPINYPWGETASTPTTTTSPPLSQPPKPLILMKWESRLHHCFRSEKYALTPSVSLVFSSKRKPAVASSKHHQVW